MLKLDKFSAKLKKIPAKLKEFSAKLKISANLFAAVGSKTLKKQACLICRELRAAL